MIKLSQRDIKIAMWDDFSERHEKEGAEVIRQFLSGRNKIVRWRKVPAARLKKIWLDYAEYGFVRDESGLNEIAESILDGIARLQFSTEMMGHTQLEPREVLESFSDDFSEKQLSRFMDFLTDKHGNYMLSDYGLDPLLKIYPQILNAKNAEEKLVAIDKALNVAHQRSDLAEFFVEGGSATLNDIANQKPEPISEEEKEIKQYASKFSKRDKYTQQWIDDRLNDDNDRYTYYQDISGEKILQWIHEDIKNATEHALKIFKQKIRLYPDIQITYGKNIGSGAVARYLSGTSTNVPIILIGVDRIIRELKKDAKENSMNTSPQGIKDFIKREIRSAIAISVLHELGHALIDELRESGYEYDELSNEEDVVEQFARDLYDGDDIEDSMKLIISDIKKVRRGIELETTP